MHDHTDCSGDHCSKLFNLYEDLNLTSSQAASVNACPTYTPATMTVTTVVPNSTAFTTTQSSYITTSIVLSITTMWTPSPQSTVTELVTITVTKAPSQIESCKPIDPTTITIPSLCEFKQPQSITLLNSSQTLGADSFSKPGVPTQEPASVLGALLGICMVLLAFVTVGWVWTCWTTSRKKKTGNISQNIR